MLSDMNNFLQAVEHGFLWPPISEVAETFLRRKAKKAGAYERIWRLIHVWEAIEVTLSLIAITRYLTSRKSDDNVLRKCREYFYGMSWNQIDRDFQSSLGAAGGSMDQWINILNEVSKDEDVGTEGFLFELKSFLNQSEIELSIFVQEWRRACDVPKDVAQKEKFTVIQAMRHLNNFRNRYAHVPFPHDLLDGLAIAFERVTEQLFSIEPKPTKHKDKARISPLTGAIRFGEFILSGSNPVKKGFENDEDTLNFVFPSHAGKDKTDQWEALPFIYIDEMIRPHIMSRIKGESEDIEYIRYRAEANAVIVRTNPQLKKRLPLPSRAEYEREVGKTDGKDITADFTKAIEAIREQRYEEAIAFFGKLTTSQPNYHVAWLNLGFAEREKAVRLSENEKAEAEKLLEQATTHLDKATKHNNREYQARAFYELSKAFYQLYSRKQLPEMLDKAHDTARDATSRSSDPKYQTWLEYVENRMPILSSTVVEKSS